MTTTIPWILHQTYKSRDVPEKWKAYQDSWLSGSDPWILKFYLDEDLRKVIEDFYPQFLSFYDSFENFIERVDFARYAILHKYGGVYADLDMEQMQSFSPLMNVNRVMLASEPPSVAIKVYNRSTMLCNACMLSPPNNPFWLGLMNYITMHYKEITDPKKSKLISLAIMMPVWTTGPMAITAFYEECCDNKFTFKVEDIVYRIHDYFEILPSCTLYSHIWSDNRSKQCTSDNVIFAVHHWTNDWIPKWTKPFRNTGKFLAEKNIGLILAIVVVTSVIGGCLLGISALYFKKIHWKLLAQQCKFAMGPKFSNKPIKQKRIKK